jgi:hypothetical protein
MGHTTRGTVLNGFDPYQISYREKGIEKEIRRIEDHITLASAATAKSFLALYRMAQPWQRFPKNR